MFEKKFLSAAGLAIYSIMLHRHMRNCESHLVPALKLRQVVAERHSEVMKFATDHMMRELNSADIRKNNPHLKLHLVFA